jgi:CBS domain-containing protein
MSNSDLAAPAVIRVRDIMAADVVSVRPDTTVRELVQVLAGRQIGGAPVLTEAGELVGIVTTTDLVRLASDAADVPLGDLLTRLSTGQLDNQADGLLSFLATDAWGDSESLAPLPPSEEPPAELDYEEYLVRDIMRSPRCVVRSDDSLEALARALLDGHVHRAPVLDDGRLVGIVTTFDVLRAVANGGAAR